MSICVATLNSLQGADYFFWVLGQIAVFVPIAVGGVLLVTRSINKMLPEDNKQ